MTGVGLKLRILAKVLRSQVLCPFWLPILSHQAGRHKNRLSATIFERL
ncbi:hypothetical protein S7335_3484 [Synechococcus sp. PCC 7335]|nr:hypothetical protein S7335_3484 [Synechococcus sp. PCC 7335]